MKEFPVIVRRRRSAYGHGGLPVFLFKFMVKNDLQVSKNNGLRLTSLVKVEALQSIQDAFSELTGLASIMIDNEGKSITAPSNFNPVCVLIEESEKGSKLCELSNINRSQLVLEAGGPAYHFCHCCGFADASAPINIGGQVIAEWLTGQCVIEGTQRPSVREIAAACGCDGAALQGAFESVSSISREYFEKSLNLLNQIAINISNLAYKNHFLALEIEEKQRIANDLVESENRYVNILNALGDGVHLVDKNLKIQFANNRFKNWLKELNLDSEIEGKTIDEAFPFLDYDFVTDYKRVFTSGEPLVSEEKNLIGDRMISTQTTRVPVSVDSNTQGIATIVRNITSEQRTLEELQKYQLTCDRASAGIAIADMNGKFLYVNESLAGMHGYEQSELLGQDMRVLHPPVQEQRLAELVALVREQGSISSELMWHVRKNGTEFPTLLNADIIFDNNGNPQFLSSTFIDISELNEAQEALCNERDLVKNIMKISPVGLLVIDANGIFTYVNQRAGKLMGLRRNDIIGCRFDSTTWKITDLDGNPLAGEKLPFNIAKTTGQPVYNAQLVYRLAEGEEIQLAVNTVPLFRSDGQFDGVVAAMDDITEFKRIESELRKSEEKFRNIIYSSPMGMHLYRLEGERLIFEGANPAADKILNVDNRMFIGKTIEEAFPPLAQTEIPDRYREAARDGKTWETEQITYKDHQIEGAFQVVAFQVAAGRMAAKFHDITEMKRLQEISERAERLETAGRIAGQVAHDFNNLLGPIMAYPELLREHLAGNEAGLELVNDIEKAATQIAEISQQLLSMGRRGHYNIEPLDLNDVLQQSLKYVTPFPENISLETAYGENLALINGGASQLVRVFTNIIKNSIDALADGGMLRVASENIELKNQIGNLCKIPPGQYVRVSVSDSGVGISCEIMNSIFDPFFTTKRSDTKRGSGLGLSVVHSVVADHGGYVDCVSEGSTGTSFYVYLPVAPGAQQTAAVADEGKGHEHLLVVDDDATQREVAQNLLANLGYKVDTAGSGEEALEKISRSAPDLLLLDMRMPGGIDGTETYRRALELNPCQRAIIVSGYAENKRVREAMELGAGQFVKKPFTLKTLSQAVRSELNRSTQRSPAAPEA